MPQNNLEKNWTDDSIIHKITLLATPEIVFSALTKTEIIDEWGGGPSRVEAKKNGCYSLWDGDVQGVIREINSPYHLLHTFRFSNWLDNWHESLVTWKISGNLHSSSLILRNSCLPNIKIRETINAHWIESFLGPLKAYLDNQFFLKKSIEK